MTFFRPAFPLLLLATAAIAQPGKGPPASLKAELYEVKRAPFARTLSTIGTLRANESVTLVAELSRLLVKIAVQEGSDVKKGDLLFKLDDSDLQAGLDVIDAKVKLASTIKKRVDDLIQSRAISQQEFDSSTADLKVLEAQRGTQTVEIGKTEIRAPFDGRVGIRQVSEGAYVTPATPLITLQDLSHIKVDFPLPERYASEVRKGQKFTFTVAGSGKAYEGSITVIEPAIDAETRSLTVRGVCDSPQGLLPGGFAEVKLTLDGDANGFTVPTQAIVPSQRGQGVYLVKDGKAELQPVEVGGRTADKVQILRGVKEGDLVVTTNLLRMRPGVEVVGSEN
jgi:membrane fusion protein (multidrug efflux system)